MDEELLRKIDARARRLLRRGKLEGDVEMLLTTAESPGEAEIATLADRGCKIDAVTRDVLSARSTVEHIEDIASLSFVRRIELSRPMHTEGSGEEE